MNWVVDNLGLILDLTAAHLRQSVVPIVLGFVLSLPLGWVAWRYRLVRGPIIALTGLLYTIPSLALLILLDQIPRNIFRGSGHAFATDGLALHYARCAVARGMDLQVDADLRAFVYLPFEHSEVLADQHEAVRLFRTLGNAEYDRYALAHLDVIERFGRFPHRNAALGRVNTADEQAWLDAGGGF